MSYVAFYDTFLTYPLKHSPQSKNATSECPFCEAPNKFSIDVKSGVGKCLSAACGETFNPASFMVKFHNSWLEHTSDEDYEILSEQRGISVATLKKAQFAYDSYKERWLVPYFNPNSKTLNNLGYFHPGNPKKPFVIYKAPNDTGEFRLQLYNPCEPIGDPPEETEEIVICEGEWDALALYDLITTNKHYDPHSRPIILATPGAGIVPTRLPLYLAREQNILLSYDNDDAGNSGVVKMGLALQDLGKTVKHVAWDSASEPVPEGTDLRDIISDPDLKKRFNSFDKLKEITTPFLHVQEEGQTAGYVSSIEDIEPVENLRTYFKLYNKQIVLSETNKLAIIGGLAISTSVYMKGEPLWGFFIGPASSGKTVFIESFGGENEMFDYASKVTDKSFVSGWSAGGDGSFFTRINGKTFLIKDFTTVINMSKDRQKELFDILRDIYDGSFRQRFGNNVERNYKDTNFNILAGVTDAIYSHNDADMGERFLRISYLGDDHDEDAILDSVLGNFGNSRSKKEKLTQATLGYVNTIMANKWDVDQDYPTMGLDTKRFISNLAKYVAKIRTKPKHDRTEGLVYRPRPEVAARLAIQFQKLSYAVLKVINPNKVWEDDFELPSLARRVVAKVAKDTCYGFSQEIVEYLYKNPKNQESKIAKMLSLPETRVHRCMKDLHLLKIVRFSKIKTKGAPAKLWTPTDEFTPLCEAVFGSFDEV